jgi:hypothetical protein
MRSASLVLKLREDRRHAYEVLCLAGALDTGNAWESTGQLILRVQERQTVADMSNGYQCWLLMQGA